MPSSRTTLGLLLLLTVVNLFVSKEGKENIVPNLDGVDVKQTLRWGYEGKVDSVGGDPNGPASHDGRLQISLDLVDVVIPALALYEVEVTEEHASKDGVPNRLIDKDLGSDRDGLGTRQLRIEEAVEEMSRRTVAEEAK